MGNLGCTAMAPNLKKPKPKALIEKNKSSNEQSSFIPSGTEVIFQQSHSFSEKQNSLNIELSSKKRCHLSTSLERSKNVELATNTVLTVVGYRSETGDLVLTDSNYQQFYISCMNRWEPQRKASSTEKSNWKKTSVEMKDLDQMSALFKLKYTPQ